MRASSSQGGGATTAEEPEATVSLLLTSSPRRAGDSAKWVDPERLMTFRTMPPPLVAAAVPEPAAAMTAAPPRDGDGLPTSTLWLELRPTIMSQQAGTAPPAAGKDAAAPASWTVPICKDFRASRRAGSGGQWEFRGKGSPGPGGIGTMRRGAVTEPAPMPPPPQPPLPPPLPVGAGPSCDDWRLRRLP